MQRNRYGIKSGVKQKRQEQSYNKNTLNEVVR